MITLPCDHCGKPSPWSVLCPDCEQLCCPNACTGRVNECTCDETTEVIPNVETLMREQYATSLLKDP